MICVPPFRAEFGLTVRYHAPMVAALPRPLTVCIEQGMQALYPNAEHIIVESRADTERKDLYRKDADFVAHWTRKLEKRYPGCTIVKPDRSGEWAEQRFIPEPAVKYGLLADVVVCPRKREIAPERNWQHWPALTHMLTLSHRVMAAGAAATSVTSVDCWASWHWPRPLDASIDMIRSARLVIATDAGMAHLAVLCGTPLLIVAAGTKPAPGAKWDVRLDDYFEHANHMNVPMRLVDAWDSPDVVVAMADEMMRAAA